MIARFTGTPTLDFKWDTTQGKNGDTLHLTVTVSTAEPLFGGAHAFAVESVLGNTTNLWAAMVVEQ